MTEIIWDEVMEGNTVRKPEPAKVIRMENIRTDREKNRTVSRKERRQRERMEEVERARLALQCIVMIVMVTLICLLDGADLQQTAVLMISIIGCGAVMLLLDDTKNER